MLTDFKMQLYIVIYEIVFLNEKQFKNIVLLLFLIMISVNLSKYTVRGEFFFSILHLYVGATLVCLSFLTSLPILIWCHQGIFIYAA